LQQGAEFGVTSLFQWCSVQLH